MKDGESEVYRCAVRISVELRSHIRPWCALEPCHVIDGRSEMYDGGGRCRRVRQGYHARTLNVAVRHSPLL